MNEITTDTQITPTQEQPAPVEAIEIKRPLADLLHDEYRSRPAATKFNDVNDLFKAYENLEGFIGKKVEAYGPEELAIINERRGIPTDLKEYTFPEGTEVATEVQDKFREIFKQAGLTKREALDLVQGFNEYNKQQLELQQNTYQATLNEYRDQIKKEFGAAYDKKIEMANRALTHYGTKELQEFVTTVGLNDHPEFIRFISKVGESLLEDSTPTNQRAATFGVTPDDAKQQIELLLADRESREAYYDRFNPKHEIVKRQMTQLYELAYKD
jgi:hypothetical protein